MPTSASPSSNGISTAQMSRVVEEPRAVRSTIATPRRVEEQIAQLPSCSKTPLLWNDLQAIILARKNGRLTQAEYDAALKRNLDESTARGNQLVAFMDSMLAGNKQEMDFYKEIYELSEGEAEAWLQHAQSSAKIRSQNIARCRMRIPENKRSGGAH